MHARSAEQLTAICWWRSAAAALIIALGLAMLVAAAPTARSDEMPREAAPLFRPAVPAKSASPRMVAAPFSNKSVEPGPILRRAAAQQTTPPVPRGGPSTVESEP